MPVMLIVGFLTPWPYNYYRLKKNIALGMVSIENSEIDNSFEIRMPESNNKAKVVLKPFYDPKKNITSKSL